MATIAGLFASSSQARSAYDDLIAEGWERDDISVVGTTPENADMEHHKILVKDAEKGAIVGGLAGLFLGLSELAVPGVGLLLVGGWIAAALIGAGVGAATGGLAGALVEAGISHEIAGELAEGVHRGEILLSVKTDESRAAIARTILQRHNAIRIEGLVT